MEKKKHLLKDCGVDLDLASDLQVEFTLLLSKGTAGMNMISFKTGAAV